MVAGVLRSLKEKSSCPFCALWCAAGPVASSQCVVAAKTKVQAKATLQQQGRLVRSVRKKVVVRSAKAKGAAAPAKIKLPDGRRPEDQTELILAPLLGCSEKKAKEIVEQMKQPEFDTLVLRSNAGGALPTREEFIKAQLQVVKFLESPETREIVAQAFLMATKEEKLVFDFDKAIRRVVNAKLTTGYRKDFKDSMALTVDDSRKTFPIYLDMLFPLTTKAMVSLLLHEALHWCATRSRAGNPRIAQETEHAAMMLLGDKDLSRAR